LSNWFSSTTAASHHRIQQVGIAGSWGNLSWNFPGQLHQMHHIFPHGTPLDIPIKFAWQVDDIWDWEYLPHYHIHLLLLDPDARMFFASYAYDTEINRVIPVRARACRLLWAWNWMPTKKQPSDYKGSRNYHYHLALDLLHKGDLAGAQRRHMHYMSATSPKKPAPAGITISPRRCSIPGHEWAA
jgi:hypothetical protein